MDAANTARQMIAFQRQSFDNLQKVWEVTQTQTVDAAERMLDQALWMPPECRRAIENWHQSMIEGHQRFSAYVNQSYDLCEKMIKPAPEPATAPAAE